MTVASERRHAHVGIVGAGQLARMTLQAAIPLALRVRLLAARADDGAALAASDLLFGAPDDPEALAELAAGCDVITFDHELVPVDVLARLEHQGACLHPSASTMALAQDKQRQRELFQDLGLPLPRFRIVGDASEALSFGDEVGWPTILKAARGGYDGRGVWIVERNEAARLATELPAHGVVLVAEEWVEIEREVAILLARRPAGHVVLYPLVETVQVDGICREVTAPASVPATLVEEAGTIAHRIAEVANVVGVMAVELFVSRGRLLVNEIATRPHNSGHYTIEGCVTSQFEQHLRAILDWPLGETALIAPAVATVNVLGAADGGDPLMLLPHALAVPGVHVHLYGKPARPGRKLGHVTALGADLAETRSRAWAAAERLGAAR